MIKTMSFPRKRESSGRMTPMMFSQRDILAVCFGLQQFFSKGSLHLEKNCRKSSQTFGQKSLNVVKTS